MIHVYKKGGSWKTEDGQEYTVKSINSVESGEYISDGWSLSLEEALKTKAKAKAKAKAE